MLQTFRKYKRSLLGIVAVGLVALAMSGFGVNLINPRKESYAVKVNDQEISYSNFQEEKRALESRYREFLGDNYVKFIEAFRSNLSQQTVDKIISDLLLTQKARSLELYAGDKEVARIIREEIFSDGFDPRLYANYLRQVGLSPAQFEEKLRSHALQSQLRHLLSDVTILSDKELKVTLELQLTHYAVKYLEVSPKEYLAKVESPSDAAIEEYYKTHAGQYELSPRVSYEYVVLDPKNFLNLVELGPDDIEFYYSENQSIFTNPEKIKAKHILLNYSKDVAARDAIKEKAKEVITKAKAGEDFGTLAKLYSEDIATSLLGGDLGWLEPGKMAKEFDKVVFKLNAGEISELIETSYGVHIVKLEEKAPTSLKPLKEVSSQIEDELRKREAPAYTSNKAHDLFEAWNKLGNPLSEFGPSNSFSVGVTSGLLEEGTDPDNLIGLTDKVLEIAEEGKGLIELGEKSILVLIKEFKDTEIAPMESVKDKILAALKQEGSKISAKKEAENMLSELTQKENQTLEDLAKTKKLKLNEKKDLSRDKADGIFSQTEIKNFIFSTFSPLSKPDRVFEANGNYYLLQVASIQKPSEEEIQKQVPLRRSEEKQKLAQLLVDSILSKLKAQAKIDVSNQVLGE